MRSDEKKCIAPGTHIDLAPLKLDRRVNVLEAR